jgi:ABC-2 type transport system permease protein
VVLVYRLLLRTLVTRARLAALVAIGLVGVLIGMVIRSAPDEVTDAERTTAIVRDLIGGFGINLVVPVTALVFASAAFGDPTEDRTMVYLWLTPLARWRMVAGGWAAALTVAGPVAVLPVAVAAAVAGAESRLVLAAAVGAALATAGYTALFLGLGLLVRRALAWGLVYVLIWELAVARIAKGAARLSVSVYARSVLSAVGEVAEPRNAAAVSTSLIVLAVVVVGASVVTTRLLARANVA